MQTFGLNLYDTNPSHVCGRQLVAAACFVGRAVAVSPEVEEAEGGG